MTTITHSLAQGSPEWHEFRLQYFGASEAAAMLGLSKQVTRTELLHAKSTGIAKEFSEWVQENILDYGHEVEALARPIIEAGLEDDLYPVVSSKGKISASCDGLTLDGLVAWEHKQWNQELAKHVTVGFVPETHMPQCQQILYVTGAEHLYFTVSDGTESNMQTCVVMPSPEWFDRIRKGWEQFEKDLAEYVPVVAEPKPVGASPETLPALLIEVTGHVTNSNLAVYKNHAMAVFESINRDLKTDQDFADAEKTIRWCGDVETRLASAKQHALSQTASIDALFNAIDDMTEQSKKIRLELKKLVDSRKESIRLEILTEHVNAAGLYIGNLDDRLAGRYMPPVPLDIAGAMKGKRTLDSLRDAASTELARFKIAANEIADKIQKNLKTVSDAGEEYDFLFADLRQIVLKDPEDVSLLVSMRVQNHKNTEAKKAEEARIAQEAREKQIAEDAAAKARTEVLAQQTQAPTPAPTEAPTVAPTQTKAAARTLSTEALSAPTLNLGAINSRFGFMVTSDFLESLGFTATVVKSAKLYHESDFSKICLKIINHIEECVEEHAQ